MRVNTLVALAAALAAAQATATAFPLQVELHNNNWRPGVEPETSTMVEPYAKAEVTVRDKDQLARVVSNIEQLNFIMGCIEDAGLSIELPWEDDGADAEAQRLAAEAEAARVAAETAEAERLAAEKAEAERLAAEKAAAAGTPPGDAATGTATGTASASAPKSSKRS